MTECTHSAPLEAYRDFLSDLKAFRLGMEKVASEWPVSCEQFLTNTNMNRIAWLGQSAACLSIKVPSVFRAGFKLLTIEQQKDADDCAAQFLVEWEYKHEHKKKDQAVS